MTQLPAAALSILLPINLQIKRDSAASSPNSPSSIDMHSDDENDHQQTTNRYYAGTPTTTRPIIRPQFSCPMLGIGTARGMKRILGDISPVLSIASPPRHTSVTPTGMSSAGNGLASPSSRRPRIRKQNSFAQLDTVKRSRETSPERDQENLPPRKRSGIFLRRPQG
jgi:hypothetical protein